MSKHRIYSTKPGNHASTDMYNQERETVRAELKEGSVNVVPKGTVTSLTFGGMTYDLLNMSTLQELEKAFKKQDYRVKLSTEALRYQAKTISEMASTIDTLQAKITSLEEAVENLRIFGLYGHTQQF